MSAGDQIVVNVSRGKELAEWMGVYSFVKEAGGGV
jgi:hypothetical protein